MMKPFVKWAGGKGKLLSTLDNCLPDFFNDGNEITYVEPFVGGGAMLFHLIDRYPQINRFIINDINPALINCYRQIKSHHKALIKALQTIHNEYYSLSSVESRKAYYYESRDEYNLIDVKSRNDIRSAALFIFINKTCFNGLYRENRRGAFNVPFGRYKNPTICNAERIEELHTYLRSVIIMNGSFEQVRKQVNWDERNFFYLDPPYRPLLEGNNFNQYTMNAFNDSEQKALKSFCDEINNNGGHFLMSNSDSELRPGVNFFDQLYGDYNIQRIEAPRSINAKKHRSMITEILVKNY